MKHITVIRSTRGFNVYVVFRRTVFGGVRKGDRECEGSEMRVVEGVSSGRVRNISCNSLYTVPVQLLITRIFCGVCEYTSPFPHPR